MNGSGVPAAVQTAKILNVQQIFPLLYTPDSTITSQDTQLFTMTGKGGISQLTGNLSGTDGWVWSGGILFQWGLITAVVTNGTVTFKDRVAGAIPFPNACYSVTLTPGSSDVAGNYSVAIDSTSIPTNTGFKYRAFGLLSKIYWFAIGN